VAGQAGEQAPAFQKALALAQVHGLVANVPGVIPIGREIFVRTAMAAATKVV
jgi:hypothetical protein